MTTQDIKTAVPVEEYLTVLRTQRKTFLPLHHSVPSANDRLAKLFAKIEY